MFTEMDWREVGGGGGGGRQVRYARKLCLIKTIQNIVISDPFACQTSVSIEQGRIKKVKPRTFVSML